MLSVGYVLEEGYVTRREVGGGLGGYLGRLAGIPTGGVIGGVLGNAIAGPVGSAIGIPLGIGLGTAGGTLLGKVIGSNTIADPEKPADFTKASHRIGHLARPYSSTLGILGNVVNPGLVGIGGGLYSAASADGAQKVGYDSIGRIGSFFTPFVGLAKPNKINPNRK